MIAIAGFENAQAATILSIALAAMANGKKWKEIVILEMGNRYIYTKIRRFFNEDIVDIDGGFRVEGVTFIPGADQDTAVRLAARENIFLIIDCGDNTEAYPIALNLCTRRILLCSLLPWRIQNLCHYLEYGGTKDLWDCMLVTEGKVNRKIIRKKTGFQMKPWIYIEDPFHLRVEEVKELYLLACEEKYITH
ncbi:MAG: hypothetical protein ACI39H_09580 [Lachnospiraceae bacterium]